MPLLLIGTFNSLFLRCNKNIDVEAVAFTSYVYTNNTENDLQIERWLNNKSNSFLIESNQELTFKLELNSGNCMIDSQNSAPNEIESCLLVIADSIKIDYGNALKRKFLPTDQSELNVLLDQNYTVEKKANQTVFRYSFTERDLN